MSGANHPRDLDDLDDLDWVKMGRFFFWKK